MERIRVTIEGTSPLLVDAFTDEDAAQIEKGSALVFKGQQGTPREQAERRLYRDEKGSIYMPGPNMFRALIDAGVFHKAGKKQITTSKSSLVPAGMAIVEICCPIVLPDGGPAPWVAAVPAVPPTSGEGER